MTKQLSIYITDEMYSWLQTQPRNFNLSEHIREAFDVWMGTESESETNDHRLTTN
jgi:hypothetical protein